MTAPQPATEPAHPANRGPDVRKGPAIALTGYQHLIAAGDYRAAVTELGGGLRQLSYGGMPLITGYEPDNLPPAGAGQLLIPWPNRVDGGRYTFGGASYQLDLSEAAHGNAIHGLTRWANWELAEEEAGPDQVTLTHVLHGRPGYPFCLMLSVCYRLEADSGLHVAVTAWNAGSSPAPYGTGSHPYLTAGTAVVDESALQIDAGYWLPADDRGIPSGPPRDVAGSPFDFRSTRPVAATHLDHALTGLARDEAGLAWARLSSPTATVGLWAGPGYDWLQVFTGDALGSGQRRKALAVEPMTCPANAFVTGDGLLTLAPDDSVTHTWGIRLL